MNNAANDPRDLSNKRLQQAMKFVGRDPKLRAALIDFLQKAEAGLDYSGSIRDDITGPIIDALHDDSDIYEKTLADDTHFRFYYRTKIARDFLMSPEAHPNHVWEPQTTRLMLKLAEENSGDVLVGGAYFGDQAILVAKRIASRGGKVHCFEPNTEQAKMLTANASLNHLSNLVVNHEGLWSESNIHLKLDGFDSFANTVQASEGEGGLKTVTIDDYCASRGVRLGLIQMDIEGAEFAALQGAKRTLTEDKPDIVFEVHRHYVDWSNGLENAEIVRYLANLGYAIYAIRDFNTHHDMSGKPVELIPVKKVYLEGPPHGFNMLALRDPSRLQSDFFRIVEGVSPKLLAHKDPALHHPLDGL